MSLGTCFGNEEVGGEDANFRTGDGRSHQSAIYITKDQIVAIPLGKVE